MERFFCTQSLYSVFVATCRSLFPTPTVVGHLQDVVQCFHYFCSPSAVNFRYKTGDTCASKLFLKKVKM